MSSLVSVLLVLLPAVRVVSIVNDTYCAIIRCNILHEEVVHNGQNRQQYTS
jgi:hypothetical protein